ncbi:hypothetical protein DUNSADRAFT_9132 [Dunaliella salina]|uniref:Uncharacterized protein n=1 Tax=Dunaliella salina TaxID=3046 RepID=A0ABQ7GI27_DUNSA|nr:hypothetical protein DUNSADRAFT_9132 [Dunaliella salina]KAF5834266.1 hypothetical protein DUNSADRAFT_9132 [Dunaliella salina]|eukprot:KAF5834265.1 hypothetical protein DUNSADRAFT_9132 [Dunaliella salina]
MRDILDEDEGPETANPTLLDASSSFQGNWRSIVALVIILLVGSVANSAGVGGGAIFVPILQSLVGFSLKDSTAISQALITAGSAVSVAINIFKRSPVNPSTCIIHFSVALALTPVVLVGVSVGVLLNSILPNWILTIMLIVLIFGLSVQSVLKGVNMWRQENKRKAEAKQENQGPTLPLPPSTLHDAAMDDEAAQSLACFEAGAARGDTRFDVEGERPLFRRAGASGTSAPYESMEGLPVPSRAVGEEKAGVGGDLSPSAQQPRASPLFGSASLDLERGQLGQSTRGRDTALVAAPSGLNSFLDALLGPVAEDMVYRQHQPEVDEGSWLQRRNRRAWRMLLQSGGELGQQFVPAPPSLHPVLVDPRPKPVQPPLPAAEAGDIIERLDSPMGFTAISNPLHEEGPSGFTAISNPLHEQAGEPTRQQQQQQQQQQQEQLEQQEEAGGMHSSFGEGELPSHPVPKKSLLSRLRSSDRTELCRAAMH